MRNVLLTFSLLLFAGMSFGQIKVVTNGDTGIGTSTPTEQLDVDGNTRVRGGTLSVGTDLAAGAAFVKVGVGRPANGSAAFDFVADQSNYAVFGLRLLRDAGGTSRFSHRGTNPLMFAANDAGSLQFLTSNTIRMQINAAGQVDINGSATVNGGVSVTSDKRLKKNIKPLEYGLKELMQINPVVYSYTGKARTSTERPYVGVVAQELQSALPTFVSEHIYSDYDDLGVAKSSETYLKVHDSELKYVILKAVQEQQELIDAQNERIAELEAAIINLSNGSNNAQSVEIRDSRLGQNAPNPFNESTVINYTVPTKSNTAIMQIFDLNGQLLKSVNVANGNGQLTINAGELAAGTYSYNLVVDGAIVDTKKMVLTK